MMGTIEIHDANGREDLFTINYVALAELNDLVSHHEQAGYGADNDR
jgi:hypothetical protein